MFRHFMVMFLIWGGIGLYNIIKKHPITRNDYALMWAMLMIELVRGVMLNANW